MSVCVLEKVVHNKSTLTLSGMDRELDANAGFIDADGKTDKSRGQRVKVIKQVQKIRILGKAISVN